jgi:type II secretory pathway component PulF
MAFKELARVDVDELRTLHKKIDDQNQNLEKVSKNIEIGVANLNQAGFQDNKFKELDQTLLQHKESVKALRGFMQRYAIYLKEQEKILRDYLSTQPLKPR